MMPLNGIRVVDFSQALAGPFAGMLLADMGADVIKVEPPSGDHIRPLLSGAFLLTANRNKRSIAVDLRSKQGIEIAWRLVEGADVLLEAFVPGVMERLGLGYDAIAERYPRIVYCSISGYGQDGPKRNRPGYDACAQAECGVMAATGEEGRPPIRTGTAFVDYSTGMCAAMGVAFALLGRGNTGRGQYIDVNLLDSAVAHMSHWITWHSLTGNDPPRSMSDNPPVTPYDVLPTKERPVFVAILRDRQWRNLCEVLGLGELADDPRFGGSANRAENRAELIPILKRKTSEFSSEDLLERLAALGIPSAPVNSIHQVVEDAHLRARGAIFEQKYPGRGPVKYVRNPLQLSETPFTMRRIPPKTGEHTEEILREVGYDKDDIERLLAEGVIAKAEGMQAQNSEPSQT